MGDFPSGQRGQTVNLLRFASVVRIHHLPPKKYVKFLSVFFCYINISVVTSFGGVFVFKLKNFAKKIFSTVCSFSIFMICGAYNVKAELTDIFTYSNSTQWFDTKTKQWFKETKKYRKDLRARINNFLAGGDKWKDNFITRYKRRRVYRPLYLYSYKHLDTPLPGTKVCQYIYDNVDFIVDAHTIDLFVSPVTIFMTLKDDFLEYGINNIRKIFCNNDMYSQSLFCVFVFRKESGERFSEEEIYILNKASKFTIHDDFSNVTPINAKFIVNQ